VTPFETKTRVVGDDVSVIVVDVDDCGGTGDAAVLAADSGEPAGGVLNVVVVIVSVMIAVDVGEPDSGSRILVFGELDVVKTSGAAEEEKVFVVGATRIMLVGAEMRTVDCGVDTVVVVTAEAVDLVGLLVSGLAVEVVVVVGVVIVVGLLAVGIVAAVVAVVGLVVVVGLVLVGSVVVVIVGVVMVGMGVVAVVVVVVMAVVVAC
jgi:hypothetical protein